MCAAVLCVVALSWSGVGGGGAAQAQVGGAVGVEALGRANRAAATGDWAAVRSLLAPLGNGASLLAGDRAELHRLRGLAAFGLADFAGAERELLAFLRLDPDAQLDPALFPPEAVRFFDDVRARNVAELRALRTPPKRYVVLNLLPPAGQFQNRQPRKGWLIGAGLAVLAATNIGSYIAVRSWCDPTLRVCEDSDGADRSLSARRLQWVGNISGGLLIGLYAYGVIDGYVVYRRNSQHIRVDSLGGEGAIVYLEGAF